MWTKVDYVPRGATCASDGCHGKPQWELNTGSVGSLYCDECHAKIESMIEHRAARESAALQIEQQKVPALSPGTDPGPPTKPAKSLKSGG